MFSTEQRDKTREWVVDLARNDARVTAGALTGSSAANAQDRWSDIDLAFGIADEFSPEAVLDDWSEQFRRELGAVHYWDLRSGSSIYRVFLLSDGLEVDVAVTPQRDFGARGPRFRAIFGTPGEPRPISPLDSRYMIGLGWHHVLHARSSIERGKPWRAEYWISAIRDEALALACLRMGEEVDYGRGIDRLSATLTDPFVDTLVRSLDEGELRRALAAATACFINELSAWDLTLCAQLKPVLEEFAAQNK